MANDNPSETSLSWRELAAKAAVETDPQKLSELVKDLCEALDGIEWKRKELRAKAT